MPETRHRPPGSRAEDIPKNRPKSCPEDRPVGAPRSPAPPGKLTGAGWMPHGFHLDPHTHDAGQLVYAAAGTLATTTGRGTWVAPAHRVTWTPPGFAHAHRFYGRTDARLLTLPAEMCGELVDHPSVFAVSPLLRAALMALTDGRPEPRPGAHARLLAVVVDELCVTAEQSLHLPEPRDDRLRAATELLHADPARPATLAELGRAAGASERTLSRLFHGELGMSFHRWRTTLRIHHALAHLSNGLSVTDTAMACGWSNPSSFIDAFSSVVGQTPGGYQADLRDGRTPA